ncbi:leucine dehydrogenase [Thermosediminibacter oceani DSM 16646]|uniref:Leucine dehydrogenase n=1 Tax=Thermosediminibacter oceani (strain ATCC BAA-1034 / DSM 16646 / JW/IW-1228P) TaxID=555079 RepID=D9RY85_THEOJ|nr:Glu/Leu/Phe/Val dehydrogenase dimerization domain-containing protein [Thermosediminibacter oceani]ADL08309.1 leucine dehydrogenase [Thermosediminibacter oceani DSM 16646]
MKIDIFKEMEKHGFEQIIFNYDKTTGLKAIIAIHDTTLGPALGGCRMWPYETEDEALIDAMRLAKGMTYKCAVSDNNFGGGKTVIIGDPKKDKSEALFRALGRFVQTLGGRYYTGTDLGTTGMDFVYASRESDYMVGLPEEYGGSGNSAVPTAYGVYNGMKAAAKIVFGSDSLKGLKVAIQGVGKVGRVLVGYLKEEGAQVIIADISEENINKVKEKYPDVEVVESEKIYDVECDIFAPCARGGIINDDTISRLKCRIVAGAANNQLLEPRHGDALHEKGILYAPDYVINAGGLIQVADELEFKNDEKRHERVMMKAKGIYDILLKIFTISKEQNVPPHKVADRLAEERIEVIGRLKTNYVKR